LKYLYNKELTLVVGSSSVGKSIALDNCASHAWDEGLNVVLITLELSEIRKAQRIDAAALNIQAQEIKNNKDKVINYYENKKNNNRLFIKEFPTNSINSNQIMNYLYQLELYEGLKMYGGGPNAINLLVVDYLDLLLPNDKKIRSDYESQGTIGAELRAVGQELDLPVLSACLHPDTIVITKNGTKKLKDLQEGEEILSYNKYNKVLKKCTYQKTKRYKITTKSGKEIICSKNHLFPIPLGFEKSIESGLSVGTEIFIKD